MFALIWVIFHKYKFLLTVIGSINLNPWFVFITVNFENVIQYHKFYYCLQQEGSLCAQHCLNALLQGSYFTPVDLASLAQQMDDEERIRMAESGVDTEDYRRFLEVSLKIWRGSKHRKDVLQETAQE